MSPVKNRVGVGVESYVVFDAPGEDGQGDLYVGSGSGGKVFRVTFSRVHETAPALSPDGVMLAFVRGARAEDSAGHRVWVMNLLNGAEREIASPEGAWPRRVAWSLDGGTLYLDTPRGVYRADAPPRSGPTTAVEAAERARADTTLSVPLGDPVRALAAPCDSGGGICALTPGGSQPLAPRGRAAFRWGADSVGYFLDGRILVRPLGGGTTREVTWSGMPEGVGRATAFGPPQSTKLP